MLHAIPDAPNKARKDDREALAQDLKAVYRAETKMRKRRSGNSESVGERSIPEWWPAGRPRLNPGGETADEGGGEYSMTRRRCRSFRIGY